MFGYPDNTEPRFESGSYSIATSTTKKKKRKGPSASEQISLRVGSRADKFLKCRGVELSDYRHRSKIEEQFFKEIKRRLSPRKPQHKFHRHLNRSWKEANLQYQIDEGEWLLDRCNDFANEEAHEDARAARDELLEEFGDERDQNRELEEKDHEYLQWWLDHNYVPTQEEVERSERFAQHLADGGTVMEFIEDALEIERQAQTPPKPRHIVRAPWRGSLQPNVSTSAD